IGINYFGQSDQLKGCINDARSIREFLIYYCNYKAWDIAMLTDDSPDPRQRPTRKNMIDAMKWLVNDAQSGDTLLFFYAGNGRQVCSEGGNRVDGYEEAILPVDYDQRGDILHEEMYHTMIRPLPTGCRLTVRYPLKVSFTRAHLLGSAFCEDANVSFRHMLTIISQCCHSAGALGSYSLPRIHRHPSIMISFLDLPYVVRTATLWIPCRHS
ncbi:caspase domain-containing protein, partial [Armillaria nabsnona]